jgi:membrane protease YdiL (CAAX protease family)
LFSFLATLPFPLRFLAFLGAVCLLWLPLALPLYLIFQADPNLTTITVMGALALVFLGVLTRWSPLIYGRSGWKDYGLVGSRRNFTDWLQGLGLGILFTLALFLTQGLLGWTQWQAPGENFGRIILEGSLTGLGVGFAEEVFFRGWLLTELDRDYGSKTALWLNGAFFAILHFLKPLGEVLRTLPQFPALFLLGVILVQARRRRRYRLGYSIGLHGGLVWAYYALNVGQILKPLGRVPDWITGIDGNPLAGLMGLLFLTLLALAVRIGAGRKSSSLESEAE